MKCDAQHELGTEQQKTYRSGVGKLLYLMRWYRSDISNTTRELSKYMMNADQHTSYATSDGLC